ncbi:unnamed protein product [Coccothraustes coccothraustes]
MQHTGPAVQGPVPAPLPSALALGASPLPSRPDPAGPRSAPGAVRQFHGRRCCGDPRGHTEPAFSPQLCPGPGGSSPERIRGCMGRKRETGVLSRTVAKRRQTGIDIPLSEWK